VFALIAEGGHFSFWASVRGGKKKKEGNKGGDIFWTLIFLLTNRSL